MKSTRQSILRRMTTIERMERGKLCPMQGGRYYNLQSWENGKNVVRYVPATEARQVAKAVDGYKKFMNLAKTYADLVVNETRKAAAAEKKTRNRQNKGI